MSDKNELIPVDVFGEVSTQVADDSAFDQIGQSTGFLQRIELKSKGKLIDKGIVRPGSYCVVQSSDSATDLGNSIDVIPLARRPKAIDMSDTEKIVVTYDFDSELFKNIEKRSAERDSHCQFGASFLVIERSTGKLYELFLGSKSNRREIGTLSEFLPLTATQIKDRGLKDTKPRGPLPVTLKSELVEKGTWSWFVMKPQPCSNPFTKKQMPDLEVITSETEKFLSSDDGNQPEAAAPAEGGRAR